MNRFTVSKKSVTKFLNWIYTAIVILFFLDAVSLVEIKNQLLKSFVCNGFLITSPFILFWNLFTIAKLRNKLLAIILPACAVAFIIIVSPLKIAFSTGTWRTQTILYENGHLKCKTIEYQMQDAGAFGYNRRTVEVLYLTKMFMITHPVSENINPGVEWIKVDRDINELGLKW